MKVRKCTPADYPSVLDIYSLSKLDELLHEKSKFTLLPLQNDKKRYQQLFESDIYVYDDNAVIAYGALYESEIRALFVHPEYRRQGIGKLLFEFLLAKIAGSARLYVASSNISAQKLYCKYGFEVVGQFETNYNGIPVVANKMEKM